MKENNFRKRIYKKTEVLSLQTLCSLVIVSPYIR